MASLRNEKTSNNSLKIGERDKVVAFFPSRYFYNGKHDAHFPTLDNVLAKTPELS